MDLYSGEEQEETRPDRRFRGRLAGGVAHDLNNILGGIVSYPELLMMELPEESPMREALGLIKSSGQKAVTIVQDLLTMARRSVVQMEVLDINALIDDFLSSPEHRKQRHYHPAAALHCELADDLPSEADYQARALWEAQSYLLVLYLADRYGADAPFDLAQNIPADGDGFAGALAAL